MFDPKDVDTSSPLAALGRMTDQQQSMFKMALLSKQIQMESQARMAEAQQKQGLEMGLAQQKHELGMIQPGQAGALAGLMGAKPEQVAGLTGAGPISEDIFGHYLQGAGMAGRVLPFGTLDAGVDTQGNKLEQMFDKRNGNYMGGPRPIGTAVVAAKDLADGKQSFQGMLNYANDFEARMTNFISQQPSGIAAKLKIGTLSLAQLAGSTAGDAMGLNQDQINSAKAFQDSLPYDAGTLDKQTLGSVRSLQLMERTQPAIFTPTDSLPIMQTKMQHLRQLGLEGLQAKYSRWNTPADAETIAEAKKYNLTDYGQGFLPVADPNAPSTPSAGVFTDATNQGFKAGADATMSTANQQFLQGISNRFGPKPKQGKSNGGQQ